VLRRSRLCDECCNNNIIIIIIIIIIMTVAVGRVSAALSLCAEMISTMLLYARQWRSQRGLGSSNLPIEKCQKIQKIKL